MKSSLFGVRANFLLAIIFALLKDNLGAVVFPLWFVVILLIAETIALKVKFEEVASRGKTESDSVTFIFLWLGHIALSVIVLALGGLFEFEGVGYFSMLLLFLVVIREIVVLMMMVGIVKKKKKMSKLAVNGANLLLTIYMVFVSVFVWEGMVGGGDLSQSSTPIWFDAILLAILSFLIVLASRIGFLWEERQSLKSRKDRLYWWGSMFAVMAGSVYAIL